jgi:hypothetical protein
LNQQSLSGFGSALAEKNMPEEYRWQTDNGGGNNQELP